MEEEKEGEREEGGKGAAGKPLPARRKEERGRMEGGKEGAGKPLDAGREAAGKPLPAGRKEEGKRAAGKPLDARRKEGGRREGGSGETAGRKKEGGRKEGGRLGGSKKNPLHLVRDGADLLIVGDSGGLLEKYFLAVLDDDALVVGTDGLTCKIVGWGIGC